MGAEGLLFCDGSNNLFFPAAGYGDYGSISLEGSYGMYWSGTLYSSNPYDAYYMSFYTSKIRPQNFNVRYRVHSVRAVSD